MNDTPQGDGNKGDKMTLKEIKCFIRMNDTPQGDGNYNSNSHDYLIANVHKNE